MAIESPKYTVIKHQGKFELRQYSGFITANVEVESDGYNNAGSQAFRYLADYIFGNNTAQGSIAMTAPVNTQMVESVKIPMTLPVNTVRSKANKYKVSFTMPASFTMKTLPKPNSAKISITEIDSHKIAVLKFAGYTGDEKVIEKIKELREWCDKNNLKTIGQPILSRFDAPWKPGFIRHNEVGFKIK
jgi:effector-binding domain-containing protein